MKKLIIISILLIMCLSLCACSDVNTTNEAGTAVEGIGRFVYINKVETGGYGHQILAYDRESLVVFYVDLSGESRYISPYQLYQDGVIYGAIYENGEIVPVPYAMGITFDMLGLASKYLN